MNKNKHKCSLFNCALIFASFSISLLQLLLSAPLRLGREVQSFIYLSLLLAFSLPVCCTIYTAFINVHFAANEHTFTYIYIELLFHVYFFHSCLLASFVWLLLWRFALRPQEHAIQRSEFLSAALLRLTFFYISSPSHHTFMSVSFLVTCNK